MKNKLIFLIIGAIILIGIGAYLFFGRNSVSETTLTPSEDTVVVMNPAEIGLTLALTEDDKEVALGISKTEGIASIEYELEYTAKGDVSRGAIGQIIIEKPGEAVERKITLGTCSDVCHYDEDVANVKITLKVVKTDGSTGQVVKSL